MRVVLSVDLPQEASTVPLVRRVLDCALTEMGVDREVRDDLALAVTEAVSNVLRHAADGVHYTVVGRLDEGVCVLEVRDHGRGFDSGLQGHEPASETAEGGRGMALMRALVDEVTWTMPEGDGTKVLLTKRYAAALAVLVGTSAAGSSSLAGGRGRAEAPTVGPPTAPTLRGVAEPARDATPGGGPAGGGPDRPRVGVVTFPGSLDDVDAARAVRLAGAEPVVLWHGDADLRGVDAVVLPGGFSYGDHLRAGALARFAPVTGEVVAAAARGLPVLGICNGFQVLCEAGLLPGALLRNATGRFVCRPQRLAVERTATAWTRAYEPGAEVVVPVKNGEGRWVADAATVARVEGEGLVAWRYVGGDPSGSTAGVAGLCDAAGRVVGLMPHPEHAVDPLVGPGDDGLGVFVSLVQELAGVSA